jgi:hypothetical protein
MGFPVPNQLQRLRRQFRDRSGCSPAVCFSLCQDGDCGSTMMCVPPVADGLTEGEFDVYLGFLAENAGLDSTFDLEATPCSGGHCGDDFDEDALRDALESGDLAPGASMLIEVTVEAADESSGDLGYYCYDNAPICEACGTFSACCSSTDCYYELPDGTQFACNGQDCSAAAQAMASYCCPPPQ